MTFNTLDDVTAWVEANGGGDAGAEALCLAIAEGRFGEKRMKLAVAWRTQYLQQQGAAGMAEDQGLTKRGLEAAEAQADIAGKSLHLSKIALGAARVRP